MNRPRLPRLCLAASLLLVAGCTRTLEAEVTRFHEVTEVRGQTATVVPADPELAGLEFNAFAKIIGRHLERSGYVAAGSADPQLRVLVGYGQAEAGTVPSNSSLGVGAGRYGRNTGVSFSGLLDLGGERMIYAYRLDLVIEDAASGKRLFEGRSLMNSEDPSLGGVMPYLAEALFKNFPGISGQTTWVQLPLKKQ